jgi:hypothetical protein
MIPPRLRSALTSSGHPQRLQRRKTATPAFELHSDVREPGSEKTVDNHR